MLHLFATAAMVFLIYRNSAVAAASFAPSPTPPLGQFDDGLLGKPRPPKPPPPQQETSPRPSGMHPPAPHVPLKGQCVMGAVPPEVTSVKGFANRETLYVDASTAAQCSGVVVQWEVCFTVSMTIMETHPGSVNVLILRVGSSKVGVGYEVVSVTELGAVPESDSEAAETTCLYLESTDNPPFVMEGDILGFVSDSDVNVALSESPEDGGSLFYFTPELQNGAESIVDTSTIQQSQLQQTNLTYSTPLIRAIINGTTKPSSSIYPTPTQTPEQDLCNGRVFTPLFTSLVVAAATIMLILIVLVCVLGCCLYQIKKSSCRCHFGCFFCCCRQRKKSQDSVEPIADQSMQYNDVYVPKDPSHIIVSGRKMKTYLQQNPAYGSPRQYSDRDLRESKGTDTESSELVATVHSDMSSEISADDELEESVFHRHGKTPDLRRGMLEHTYETIPV